MKYIQNIVQTNNEKNVSYVMLAAAAVFVVLFVVYIMFMYQVTHVAYAISKQERQMVEYADKVAVLENSYHTKKQVVTEDVVKSHGFAKMGQAKYVSVDTQTYSLAR